MEIEDQLHNESLRDRQVRRVYLITYSQANADSFPTRESFVSIIQDAFTANNIQLLQWVCAKENHEQSGFHFHMSVKLSERRRWIRVRNYIARKHGVHVNFSNRHDNYYSAWKYTTKEDLEYIQSEGHPDLTNAQPPQTTRASGAWRRGAKSGTTPRGGKTKTRKRQLSVYEVSQLVVTKKIKSRIELLSFAQQQQREGKTDLAQFIANRGSKAVDEAIRVGWELKEAPSLLLRYRQSRLERLQVAFEGDCILNCNKKWLELARNILMRNNIEISEFVGAVRLLLEQGRGKYRNILVTGPSNCGKTFILNPLNVIYDTFSNPASASFAWVGVENCEVIFLNDFRWSAQVIPWHNLLLLLEGQMVRFPAPKTHYAQDIVFEKDAPIFATANEHFSFVRGGAVDRVETEMMRVRWRCFQFFSQIPQDEQVDILSCPRCFAEFILY